MNSRLLIRTLLHPELKSISGRNYTHVLILFLIYLFSIFCIGSSSSILTYLNEQMDNEYVKMIDADINPSRIVMDDVMKFLSDSSICSDFSIASTSSFTMDYKYFSSPNSPLGTNIKSLKIGVIDDMSHPIWSMVVKNADKFIPNDNVKALSKTEGNTFAIYLTESSYLKFFNDEFNDLTLRWNADITESSQSILMPIGGVCTKMPFDFDAIILKDCYRFIKYADDSDFNRLETTSYYSVNSSELQVQAANISSFDQYDWTYKSGFIVVEPWPSCSFDFTSLSSTKEFSISKGDLSFLEERDDDEVLCVTFKDLNYVEPFSEFLIENSGEYSKHDDGKIEIDLKTIQTKKYLKLFNSFGIILSIAVALISIILIINYSIAILRLHISNNKRNLGTLLAFGFKNLDVVSFYLLISSMIICLSFFSAHIMNYFFGDSMLQLLISQLNLLIDNGSIVYGTPPLELSIPCFLIIPLFVLYVQIYKLLKTSPGDLIYNR